MVVSKNCSVIPRVLFSKSGLICFQGHYVNRYRGDIYSHCHVADQQKRTFINFPKPSRKRIFSERQLVGYSMDQVFEVVSDVESYYKFVPWCKRSVIISKTPQHIKADLVVGFPPVTESYTSNVTLIKPNLVKAECVDGKLFDHMLTLWRFSPGLKREQQSCVIDFHISFLFKSAFHSHLTHLFFDQVARQTAGAFIKEVGRRKGPATLQPRNLPLNENNILKS